MIILLHFTFIKAFTHSSLAPALLPLVASSLPSATNVTREAHNSFCSAVNMNMKHIHRERIAVYFSAAPFDSFFHD